jgi:kumamolisin
VRRSHLLGATPANESIGLALVLPLRNQAQLDDLLQHLYAPGDPAYGHYLTPAQFTAQFGPTQTDYDTVIAWARAKGLNVTRTVPNRRIVDVSGPAHVMERAFGVQLRNYQAPDGRVFRAPTSDAQAPAAIAARLSSVFGLDTATQFRPYVRSVPAPTLLHGGLPPLFKPAGVSGGFGETPYGGGLTGPNGGLSPLGIQTAYDLTTVSETGTGQTLALFELDGYTASDITTYEQQFGINPVPLQNILIDNFDGNPATTFGAQEVTLDICMMIALAQGASKILVYMGPNNNSVQPVIDIYNQIATDDLANQVSTSWGGIEDSDPEYSDFFNTENTIFQQMAAQGQSIYAAAGDSGSFADPTDFPNTLLVSDPAGQPLVTGVGGTSLTVNSNGDWQSEVVWNDSAGAGGGGISILWPIPAWQKGVFKPSLTFGSATMRNVPDVALDADPYTGYALCFNGSWDEIFAGTSAATPLWSAFTALVNQARVANNCPVLGFANPTLYSLATYNKGENYKGVGGNFADFHDITSGNNNTAGDSEHYRAVTGYDDATGWGSFDGANLFGDLVSLANNNTLAQLIGNDSFENTDGGSSAKYAAAIAPWTSTPDVIALSPEEPAHSGNWVAWLCGYGATHTDTLAQTVRIPSLATAVSFSFYLHIDTAETTKTLQHDTLTVQVKDLTANTSQTLATYSNLDAKAGYVSHSFALSASTYAGHTLQILLTGSENSSLQTSFVLDDFALAITE